MTVAGDSLRLVGGGAGMRRAMAWAIVFAVLWAGLEGLLVERLHKPYSFLQIEWCRFAVHLGLVVLIWGRRAPGRLLRTTRPASQIGRSLLMLAMPSALLMAILHGASHGFVWSVFWIAPALVIGLAWLFLKERPPLSVSAASIVGAVAAAVIFGEVRPLSHATLALALAAALSFSLYVVMTRTLRAERPEVNLAYVALPVFIVLTPVMPVVWMRPDAHDAVVLTLVGALGLGALYALERACRAAPAWTSASAFFTQALCVASLIMIASEGPPSVRAATGMAVILILLGALWLGAARITPPDGVAPGRV